jgi:hypothetical protein
MGARRLTWLGAWLGLHTALLAACGGYSKNSGDGSAGSSGEGGPAHSNSTSSTGSDTGTGQGGTSASGSPTAGPSTTGQGSSMDTASSTGGVGTGGRSNATNGASGAGAGGVGGDGVECGDTQCQVGEVCASCRGPESILLICAAHPDTDPAGFAEATAECQNDAQLNDCDGPEDCGADQYCVAFGNTRCSPEPPSRNFCCFSCGAVPECVLCRSDEDCPGGASCVEVLDAPGGFGCQD